MKALEENFYMVEFKNINSYKNFKNMGFSHIEVQK
jgi:hypothetical protein